MDYLSTIPLDVLKIIANYGTLDILYQVNRYCRDVLSDLFFDNHTFKMKKVNLHSYDKIKHLHDVRHLDYIHKFTSLQTIEFGKYFDHPISPLSTLTQLHTIVFGSYFNQPIHTLCNMPFSKLLKTITFGKHFNQPINSLVSMDSLQTLVVVDYKLPISQHLRDNVFVVCARSYRKGIIVDQYNYDTIYREYTDAFGPFLNIRKKRYYVKS